MRFLDRWRAWPTDVRWTCNAVVGYCLWLVLCAIAGPPFALFSFCLVYPFIVVVSLRLIVRVATRPGRGRHLIFGALTLAWLTTCLTAPWGNLCVTLHLIGRVYLAGGPDALNGWAQGLIRNTPVDEEDAHSVPEEQIPPGIRRYLNGRVYLGRTVGNDVSRLRIELGGGFYHYGVVVYPPETVAPRPGWERLLGWPTEVFVDHD